MLSEVGAEAIARQIVRPQSKVRLFPGDCMDVLSDMLDESAHMVLTDPPYFLDGLDDKWKKGNGRTRGTGSVGGLPVGMKFDPKQGVALQKFMSPISEQLYRILKPGAFALVFSAPRLYHRMAIAFEDAGFEIRDLYAWRFTRRAQFKAFSLAHFVEKSDIPPKEKAAIIRELENRKTPQLRPQFEAILCAQKPRSGTFIDNWLEHGTGLIDAAQTLKGTAPSTVMTVEKEQKNSYNGHLTPKPVRVCEHLIRLFTKRNQLVIDPFSGSGTTCVAAYKASRHSIGIDINPEYIQIAKQRIEDLAHVNKTEAVCPSRGVPS